MLDIILSIFKRDQSKRFRDYEDAAMPSITVEPKPEQAVSSDPFKILGKDTGITGEQVEATGSDLKSRIESIINSSDVVLFMKGNPMAPQCGFSANTSGILSQLGVQYKTFDILSDMEIREGLKSYSNWPTFPQLYVKGKLIGGNDIITEMYQDGELQDVLKEFIAQ